MGSQSRAANCAKIVSRMYITLEKFDQSYTHILLKGNPRKRKPMPTNHTHTFYLRGILRAESQSCAANCAKIVGRRVNEALTPCAAKHWV